MWLTSSVGMLLSVAASLTSFSCFSDITKVAYLFILSYVCGAVVVSACLTGRYSYGGRQYGEGIFQDIRQQGDEDFDARIGCSWKDKYLLFNTDLYHRDGCAGFRMCC